MIHSFSYHFPGQEPVIFLEEYPRNFWMQGQPNYDNRDVSPVRHAEGWYLQVEVDMTVNGERYQVSERIHAIEERQVLPLILYALQ